MTRLCAILAAMLAGIGCAAGHDIPADVRLNAFVKPAGNRLELLVRMPMAALVEAELPLRGPGYLEMSRVDDALRSAVKLYLTDNITVQENDAPLPVPRLVALRVSLPSDKSFTAFDSARAHVLGPRLADNLDLVWSQQFLDVLLEYPIRSDVSEFAIHPRFDRLALRGTDEHVTEQRHDLASAVTDHRVVDRHVSPSEDPQALAADDPVSYTHLTLPTILRV